METLFVKAWNALNEFHYKQLAFQWIRFQLQSKNSFLITFETVHNLAIHLQPHLFRNNTGTRHETVSESTNNWKFCHLMLVRSEFVIFMVETLWKHSGVETCTFCYNEQDDVNDPQKFCSGVHPKCAAKSMVGSDRR